MMNCADRAQVVTISNMKLSVVMPVYNERPTLRTMIERVLGVPMEIELICVDDGSRDGSREILGELEKQHAQIRVFLQPRNLGKGAALRRGIHEATGNFCDYPGCGPRIRPDGLCSAA
jgi:glycosyltransferase involved in cell wall biosynthesis